MSEIRLSRLVATVLVVAVMGVGTGVGTWSAFSSTRSNTGNSIASGTVSMADNDGGSTAMLAFSNALPGTSDTSCIRVTYNGSLASSVRLYGTTTGTGLDPYLNLTITRGTHSTVPAFDSCTNFVADTTNYVGAGAGVVYNGTLQNFGDTYAAGLVDPTSAAPESWTTGEVHVYKIVVSVQENVAAEGKNASQTFTWEARNQ